MSLTTDINNGRCGDKLTVGWHPARFPAGLAEQMVTLFGDVILDPFVGSGTTGVACLQTGRLCVGIEGDESYCEMAARRLDRTIDEGGQAAAA